MFIELTRPFSYLTVKHGNLLPLSINWLLPLAASAVLVAALWKVGVNIDMFGPNGAVSRVLSFVQSLPGFYLAALAAISTFDKPDMDKLMGHNPPTMTVHHNGVLTVVKATRRRFLSSMFAFLTASSLLLTLLSIFALAIADPLATVFLVERNGLLKAVFSFVYLTLLGQMLTVTFWGLYYLGERASTP